MRATTTAMVRDLDVSFDDALLVVQGYYVSFGLGPDIIGDVASMELVTETVAGMAEIAAPLPGGTVVGRRLDELVLRSEPSGVGDH